MANDKRQGIRKRGSQWYIRVQIDGKRVEIPAGTDYNQAKAYRKELKEQRTSISSLIALESKESVMSYAEAIQEHNDNHLQFKKSGEDLRGNLNATEAIFGKLPINEITWQAVERFRNARLKEVKPSTVKRELTMMSAVLKRQIKADKLESNPVAKVDLPKVQDTRDRILTDEEFKRLLTVEWKIEDNGGTYKKTMEPHTRLAIIIADYTALRIGEVLKLQWVNIDFETGKIYVQESKNGEKREVPIHDELKKILESAKDGKSEYVVNENGKPVSYIHKGFRAARKKAGLENFRIHDLRHRAITRWVRAGYPPNVIMKATGHKTYSAFNRYANLKGDDIMVLVGKKSKELPLVTLGDLQAIAS